jgi:uncharacterized membrane protein
MFVGGFGIAVIMAAVTDGFPAFFCLGLFGFVAIVLGVKAWRRNRSRRQPVDPWSGFGLSPVPCGLLVVDGWYSLGAMLALTLIIAITARYLDWPKIGPLPEEDPAW